jgi:adenylate cyclase
MENASLVTRRLSAVAFADVVNWSSHVERNDLETLRAWKSLRADLIEPKYRAYHGRLQHTTGDGMLVEFASAVDAVAWALETQQDVSQVGMGEGTTQLSLRIAINVEDVIVDDDTIIGDGVNVAARILEFARPGEVVVTGSVRDYVWNKMTVSFGDLGDRSSRG